MKQENEKDNMFLGGSTALETWENAWSKETHETEFAQKRIKSAKSAKLTPVQIDTKDLYGYFKEVVADTKHFWIFVLVVILLEISCLVSIFTDLLLNLAC